MNIGWLTVKLLRKADTLKSQNRIEGISPAPNRTGSRAIRRGNSGNRARDGHHRRTSSAAEPGGVEKEKAHTAGGHARS